MKTILKVACIITPTILTISCGFESDSSDTSNENPMAEESGIVGGAMVSAKDVFARSTVMLDDSCSGTLLNKTTVLTAAHCVESSTPKVIKFGIDGKKGSMKVLKVIKKSGYAGVAALEKEKVKPDRFAANDFAILKVSGTIPSGFGPAALPAGAFTITTKFKEIHISGFGRTGGDDNSFGTLRKVAIPSKNVKQVSGTIQVTTSTKGACQGDSGGPVYGQSATGVEVIGVVSNGRVSCDSDSFYGDVGANLSWIKSNMK